MEYKFGKKQDEADGYGKMFVIFPQIQIHGKTLGFFIEENLSDTNTNSIRFK